MIKTLEIKNIDLNAPNTHGHHFNVKRYIEKTYNSETCSIGVMEKFHISLIDYFMNNFELIYHSPYSLYMEGMKNKMFSKDILHHLDGKRKPCFHFKNNDCVISLNIVDGNKQVENDGLTDTYYSDDKLTTDNNKRINENNSKICVTIYYPTSIINKDLGKMFSFLNDYIIDESEKNHVSMLIKNTYGEYNFEPLDIKVPDINFELNYGENFLEIKDKILYKLKNNNKGLYMFHGDAGTGKSSFIKYLASTVDKEFIFIPTSFVDKFVSDPDIFSILLKKRGCVLILEDAERILISRENRDNEYISTILNLSDGILSDMLAASVIITYNCDETKIDKALKRKGRTMVDYKFGKLKINDSKKLAKFLKIDDKKIDNIDSEMSLSEIYNMEDDNKYYEEEEKNNIIIGFGKK